MQRVQGNRPIGSRRSPGRPSHENPVDNQALFFDDALSAQVFSQGVYASKGTQDQKNADDSIYQQSQGLTLLSVVREGEGYAATFEIAIQTT